MTQNHIGERRILTPGKLKWSLVTLISLVFVALGLFLVDEKRGVMPWLITLFFGFGTVISLSMLLGIGSQLILSSEGFEVKTILGRDISFTKWRDCSVFGLAFIAHNKLVVFNRLQDEGKAISSLNRTLVGGAAALPDTYGMKAHDLVDLMNAYREKALSQDEL